MTTPIKPPGHGVPPTSPSEVDGTRAPASSSTGESFKATLDRTTASASAKGATAPDAVRALVDDLRAGKITLDGALDTLVARALGNGAAKGLGPAQRRELETMLRSALADDPHLVALTKDLARGQ
ncbi:MAG: hypothetical protein IPK60_11950 [Sandaracinaceae bacterium]|jgi:hypothetical protein|nr:hypothetical protein [Sandaracinaceae bacterium]